MITDILIGIVCGAVPAVATTVLVWIIVVKRDAIRARRIQRDDDLAPTLERIYGLTEADDGS